MSRRVEGIDVARGVASLIMIQGHAYDGWVAAEHKTSAAYLFTRLLGSLPLPAFLVLAGAAIALRVEASQRRGESAARVRRSVAARGFTVLAWGYAASLAYGLMDGAGALDVLLRADVLHVIGVSIVLLAALGIRGARSADLRTLGVASALLVIVPTLACPWLAPLGAHATGPGRFLVALFVDVPGVTLMPVVPLVAWVGVGALAALMMMRARRRAPGRFAQLAGAPAGWLARAVALALAVAALAAWGTRAWVDAAGVALTRSHPAVWLNVLDLGARGVLVLAASAWVAPRLPASVRGHLVRLGRASLIAYVFHIPFCYGRLGEPLRGRLDMASATAAVLGLMAVSYAVVWARDRFRMSSRLAIR